MRSWLRFVLLITATVLSACGGDTALFGPIPQIVCGAQSEPQCCGDLPEQASIDRMYRMLLPHFGPLRGSDVPFTNSVEEYEVTAVKIATLRRSCDIAARVRARPAAEHTGKESMRLYFLSVDRKGKALARGIVFASPDERGDWHGEATFHMLSDAARYRDFDRMVFVPRDRFNAAANEIRKR